ncbi:beta-1,3-galactosyltransferase 1-like [Diadema antillarum]|uniref:beta-1,3-galactosyltransferase 1-like n=1 Tax=Diadema antillarum TaxID=105358 RepID=UPI003A862EAE
MVLFRRHSVNLTRRHSDFDISRLKEAAKNCSCMREILYGSGNKATRASLAASPTVRNNISSNIDIGRRNRTNATAAIEIVIKRRGKYLSEPIDRHNYAYIHNPSRTCFHENGTRAGIYLLFFVATAPQNFDRREAIRRSFGNELNWPTIDRARSKTVFLLGRTYDSIIQGNIDKEAVAHGDIVQESFVDSYLNLTRKTVMGMKWVTNYCRHARFVMKIDDDTTVNQSRIMDIVNSSPRVNFITGFVHKDPGVDRNSRSKFFLTSEYYPESKFPDYFKGMGYIMSSDLMESIYQVALTQHFFPFEDVFVGMCLEKMGARLNHDPKFLYQGAGRYMLNPATAREISGHTIFTDLPKDYVWRIFDKCKVRFTS